MVCILNKCLVTIENMIKKVKQDNETHPDVISGLRPTLSTASYTRILCFNK